jgi:hypothetical protein
MDKQKYGQHLKEVGRNTILDLEPLVKKSLSGIIDIGKIIVNDTVSKLFDKARQKEPKQDEQK